MRLRFEDISEKFVQGFFTGRPDVEKAHAAGLRRYLAESMSYAAFEHEMIEGDRRYSEREGRPMDFDAVVQAKPTSEQAIFLATVSQMAVLNVFSHLSVYQHQFIDPTEVQKRLFAKATDFDEKVCISAIREEVKLAEFLKENPKVKVGAKARVFRFRTPDFTWEQLFGRAGFLVVDDDKVVSTITTSLN